jgi:hypothetical protein
LLLRAFPICVGIKYKNGMKRIKRIFQILQQEREL